MIGMTNENGCRHRSGSETRAWSNFVDFLASPSVPRLYGLLGLVEDAHLEALNLVGAGRAYQHYVENCQRLVTKPRPWDRALAKWIETF